MQISLEINGRCVSLDVKPNQSLLDVLRKAGYTSVKHGCETGECGACSVLLDGRIVPSCILLAAQVDGQQLLTVEGLSNGVDIHPIQQAFMETGAVQCGYCTPGMILSVKALLDKERYPDLDQARDAIGSTLCRCTGYVRPVEAVIRAAALLRGESTPSVNPSEGKPCVVGASEIKKDAVRLVKGRPSFTDDVTLPGMLYAAMLTSPVAHANIRRIDSSKARTLPGVRAVLTYQDLPRVMFASGCQSYPNPYPFDQVSLDHKVRYIGDRVAVVAAESYEIARQALDLIEVDYEPLPAVFDPFDALKDGAPVIHDEPDAVGILDARHNLVTTLYANLGDVDRAIQEADLVYERTYHLKQVQQTPIEPHVCITYWDEDDRLVVRTSTQAPYHLRRVLAQILNLPVSRIRVIKPRIGGGFGGKMDINIEDLAAHLTMKTGRPVRFELTREEEFLCTRSRHPAVITYRVGLTKDRMLNAVDMRVTEDTGAYGLQGMTTCNLIGVRGLSTYRCPNQRYDGRVAYTNKPVPAAFRGFGGPQAQFAMESLMDEIAADLGMDPIELRAKNAVRSGDTIPITGLLGEGGAVAQVVQSCALPECVEAGKAAMDWQRRDDPSWKVDPNRPNIRRGLGMAFVMHGTAIPGLDMGAANLMMNDDGGFSLMVGATDLGTGSDTVLAQIAAETLGVPLSKITVYSSDTDITPFDVGAYASSTTFISGNAVRKAAEMIRDKLFARAASLMGTTTEGMTARDGWIYTANGQKISHGDIGLHTLHTQNQEQLIGTASYVSMIAPPAFGAQFAEVEVDITTGEVRVKKMGFAVDCGTVINPQTAVGQIEGGQTQALGYAICEEMIYDEQGRLLNPRFGDYHIFQAEEMPEMVSVLVPSYENSGPYGAKGLGEIVTDGGAAAIANAVFDATGVRIRDLPILPEKVWRGLHEKAKE